MGGRYWTWLIARLAVGVAIFAWAFSYVHGGGSAEKEFQRTLDAMKQVHSFRVATTASQRPTQHNELFWEVDCQRDLLHYRWHFVDTSVDPATELNQDNLDIGEKQFEHQTDGSWAPPRYPGSAKSAKGYCRDLAQGTDSNLLPQIATMIKRGILQKGDKKTVNGVRCREWLVTMKGGTSGLEHDTICIGLADHLPYEMTVDWENSHTSFSDYNAPIQFGVPDAALQPASATAESN